MTCVCLWSPSWSTGAAPLAELAGLLLEEAPRVAVEARGVLWADARGLPAERLARGLLERLEAHATVPDAAAGTAAAMGSRAATPADAAASANGDRPTIGAGIAGVAVAAELAARSSAPAQYGGTPARGPEHSAAASEYHIVRVLPGNERVFLAPLSLDLLMPSLPKPDSRLRALLEGVGIRTCGQLAALELEAVEVRFGAAGAALWRLARADDPRRLFHPIPRERPHASLDFIDYAICDAGRLAFTANALLESVCAELRKRGERPRRMTLRLVLSGGGEVDRSIGLALPTAARARWLRRIRDVLERLSLPDSVDGVGLFVERMEPASGRQGDLFDRGFASEATVEEAVARLVDAHGPLFVEPTTCEHPLPERRTEWTARDPADVARTRALRAAEGKAAGMRAETHALARTETAWKAPVRERPEQPEPLPRTKTEPQAPAHLTLQLLPEPRRIRVQSRPRRDHRRPVQYSDGNGWEELGACIGPHRISGGHWEADAFAREYFQCMAASGRLLWLYRDARNGLWYLHGWWD